MSVLTNLSSDVVMQPPEPVCTDDDGRSNRCSLASSAISRANSLTLGLPRSGIVRLRRGPRRISNVFVVVHAAMSAAQKTVDDPKIAAMPLSHFAIRSRRSAPRIAGWTSP